VGDRGVGQARRVLQAVDTGGQQAVDGLGAEHVRGHPRAVLVRGVHRLGQNVLAPQRAQVAGGAVDPVADELHPAVATASLLGHRLRQLVLVFQLDPDPGQVALGPRQVGTGPDDPRQVGAPLQR
jgi:hypothetical protein